MKECVLQYNITVNIMLIKQLVLRKERRENFKYKQQKIFLLLIMW